MSPDSNQPHVRFIGAGNMASSLVGGLIKNGYPTQNISASDPSVEAGLRLASRHGITTTQDNLAGIESADVIVLAVKPQHMQTVVENLATHLQQATEKPLLLSIAAGITTDSIQQWAQTPVPVVRAMPNTPALIGQGATGMFATAQVSNEQKQAAEKILSSVGRAFWLPEETQLDAVTAISGSGPAYFFLFMQALQEAGQSLGLPAAISRELVLQTALGSAALARASETSLAELRRQVTSPGGTTEAALKAFDSSQLPLIIQKAVEAAHQRAGELSRDFG